VNSKPLRWLAYLGGWTLFAPFFISEDAGRQLYQGQKVEWHGYLVVWLTTAFAWAVLAPFVWLDCAAQPGRPAELVAERPDPSGVEPWFRVAGRSHLYRNHAAFRSALVPEKLRRNLSGCGANRLPL
jgi:hypothetical protein